MIKIPQENNSEGSESEEEEEGDYMNAGESLPEGTQVLVEQIEDLGEAEGQNLILEEERNTRMDWEAILVTEVVRFLPMGTSARFEYTSESIRRLTSQQLGINFRKGVRNHIEQCRELLLERDRVDTGVYMRDLSWRQREAKIQGEPIPGRVLPGENSHEALKIARKKYDNWMGVIEEFTTVRLSRRRDNLLWNKAIDCLITFVKEVRRNQDHWIDFLVEDNEDLIEREYCLLYITRLTAQQAIVQDEELFDEISEEEYYEQEMYERNRIIFGALLMPQHG